MPAEIADELYPQDVPGTNPMANRDYHVTYYGEIVAAYIAGYKAEGIDYEYKAESIDMFGESPALKLEKKIMHYEID